MQPLKKFSPESIRAIARNPNIDLQSIGIYSKSDIQHHICFSDIYAQDYSGYFKDIRDYIYFNGEKSRPQDKSQHQSIKFFQTLK